MSLRLYDAATEEWSVYWIGSRDGLVGEPVRGPWDGDGCRFVGDDVHTDGRPMLVTYEWSDITPVHAQWQQTASLDDGRTWEKNWEMHFHRTDERPLPVPGDHLPKVAGDFDFLTGIWRVQHRKLRSRLTGCTDWDEFECGFEARTHLNGLVSVDEGPLQGVDGTTYRGMTFRTYDVAAGEWVLHWFDSGTSRWTGPRCAGGSSTGWASSSPRTTTTASPSCAGSAGRCTDPSGRRGSRRSRPTTAAPGRPTG